MTHPSTGNYQKDVKAVLNLKKVDDLCGWDEISTVGRLTVIGGDEYPVLFVLSGTPLGL
jgi:hypothetical protein